MIIGLHGKFIFTDEEKHSIAERYINGESTVKISKSLGLATHKQVLRVVHEMGIDVSNGLSRFNRKYKINENYFDNIDTPNKAYILGFLYADGHNEIPKGTVQMSLQEEDRDILENIRLEVNSERPLEFIDYSNKHDFGYTYKNQFRLLFFSIHMCKTLEKIGMIKNKSLSLEFPDIPKELYSHFIRGYFDGDGSISKTSGSFSIISTYNFVKRVKEILDEELNLNYGIISESRNKNGITHDLDYHRKAESYIIYKWLYKDADLYLQRKRDICKNIHGF